MNDTLSEINGINNINTKTNYFMKNNPSESIYPELGSPPVGPYVSPIPPEQLMKSKLYTTMTCYNCLSVLLVRKDWNFTRCGECQKINRIPKEQITENFDKYNYYQEDNDLLGDIPYIGNLFKNTDKVTEKVELVILIRPIVAGGDTWKNELRRSNELLEKWYPSGLQKLD